jgi:hypothetical protein
MFYHICAKSYPILTANSGKLTYNFILNIYDALVLKMFSCVYLERKTAT